jgi:hypothetical protein
MSRHEVAAVHYDPDARLSEGDMYSARVVCFCDIPLADIPIHMAKYSQFGISFSKRFLTANGASPVFYVAKDATPIDPDSPTAGVVGYYLGKARLGDVVVDEWLNAMEPHRKGRAELFEEKVNTFRQVFDLIEKHLLEFPLENDPFKSEREHMFDWKDTDTPMLFKRLRRFIQNEVFSFIKVFDSSLSDDHPDNYYMEREWRVRGPVRFDLANVWRIIIPERYRDRLRQDLPEYTGQVTFAERPM